MNKKISTWMLSGALLLPTTISGCNSKPTADQAINQGPRLNELLQKYKTLRPGEKIPTFIMCSPKHLTKDPEYKNKYQNGWELLTQTIEGLGGKIITLDADNPETGYGAVWTRDPVLVFPKKKLFIESSTYHPSKRSVQQEAKQISGALLKEGFKKIQVDHFMPGGGDVLIDEEKGIVFIGYDSGRTMMEHVLPAIQNATGYKVIPIQRSLGDSLLSSKGSVNHPEHKIFYHLDTGMAKLPHGEYIVSESLTTAESLETLKKELGNNLIIVRDKLDKNSQLSTSEDKRRLNRGRDAQGMSYNLIAVGETLVMPHCTAELEKELQCHGYTIVTPNKLGFPEDSWWFSNGSVHCATQQIVKLKELLNETVCSIIVPQEIYMDRGHTRGV